MFLTEVDVSGGRTRTTSSISLRNCWVRALEELGTGILHDKMPEDRELSADLFGGSPSMELEGRTILASGYSLADSMNIANAILGRKLSKDSGVIVVTGSLHAVSSVLQSLNS